MSVENVKKFYEVLSQDETLKQKFVELSRKYQGQPMDEAKMQSIAEQEVLTLAAQMGYPFTMDDLNAYGEEMKRAHMNRELNDEELQAVTGGGTTGTHECCIIGVPSVEFSGFCFFLFSIVNTRSSAYSVLLHIIFIVIVCKAS